MWIGSMRRSGSFVASPGTNSEQETWQDVTSKLDSCRTDDQALACVARYIIPLAISDWAAVALDPGKLLRDRIIYGHRAQRVFFDCSYKIDRKRLEEIAGPSRVTNDALTTLGRRLIDTVVELITKNTEPPPDLFPPGSSSDAVKAGYRFLRIEMHNHQTGWYGLSLKDDKLRAKHYAKAYKSGLAHELMWLHSIVRTLEIAYANNAWNLAIHAADWQESLRYADELFKYFPQFISEQVMGLRPVCEDRTVWPGIAAIVSDSRYPGLDCLRDQLGKQRDVFSDMMTSVRRMLPGIVRRLPYHKVMELGNAE
jgi:hypothetical protein